MNLVVIEGRLGRDVELRFTQSSQAVANFTVAVNETWVDKQGAKQERVFWASVVCWGKLGELCKEYLKKGSRCLVQGKLATRQYQGKTGETKYITEIIAENVKFLDNHAPSKNAEVPSGDQPAYFTE